MKYRMMYGEIKFGVKSTYIRRCIGRKGGNSIWVDTYEPVRDYAERPHQFKCYECNTTINGSSLCKGLEKRLKNGLALSCPRCNGSDVRRLSKRRKASHFDKFR